MSEEVSQEINKKAVVLTPNSNQGVKKLEIVKPPDVICFLIGGAGDKKPYGGTGPNGNIVDVQRRITSDLAKEVSERRLKTVYLGYYEVYKPDRISTFVLSKINSKKSSIYIVGHSLGGWNGAHLSRILSNYGYDVRMLITLDPVGEGFIVERVSDIYSDEPSPKAKYWVNLRYHQNSFSVIGRGLNPFRKHDRVTDVVPNWVADFGEQWNPLLHNQPDIYEVVDVNHSLTVQAMDVKLTLGQSAWEIFKKSVQERLGE
ncbi:alpha/beta hydrolase [Chromobacterium violaceum]|uniref:hypothetical protein n=1 Tax=Chromobacterium violaceum TaxID=536 RepID=UPI003CFA014F